VEQPVVVAVLTEYQLRLDLARDIHYPVGSDWLLRGHSWDRVLGTGIFLPIPLELRDQWKTLVCQDLPREHEPGQVNRHDVALRRKFL
jgi:hypothetical protein